MNFALKIFRYQDLRKMIIALIILVIMRIERKLFIHLFHTSLNKYMRELIIFWEHNNRRQSSSNELDAHGPCPHGHQSLVGRERYQVQNSIAFFLVKNY